MVLKTPQKITLHSGKIRQNSGEGMGAVSAEARRVLNPLELDLQTVVSCPVRILGAELGPSGRAVCIVKH